VISQGKAVTLDRWGGKWNHLLMMPRLGLLTVNRLSGPKVLDLIQNQLTG